MKKNKNLKIKILISVILLVILSIIAYISQPYISNALEAAINDFNNQVGAITTYANPVVTMDNVQIHEHRGHSIWAIKESKTEAKTYENAEGNTGIANIGSGGLTTDSTFSRIYRFILGSIY